MKANRSSALHALSVFLFCSGFLCSAHASEDEHLGTVNFPVSCTPAVQPLFDRGVAVLHSFWYEEAEAQFDRIATRYPQCAMAHWGLALSLYHQIWERPGEATNAKGWAEMQKAQALATTEASLTPRERAYITVLSAFYQPGPDHYEKRVTAYSAAMGKLRADYPKDVDAAAFYALSLLAKRSPGDLSLTENHAAMDVLGPLFIQYPDNPGVDHYITHACDTPSMAAEGLAAAQHYEVIASSVPHGVHMPSHIYSRLGMWQPDILSNSASVADSQHAESVHQGGVYDQLHADDFLLYAYLQSANDRSAQLLLYNNDSVTGHLISMASMDDTGMAMMIPYFRVKLPLFYMLEMRDWPSTLAFDPPRQQGNMPSMKRTQAENDLLLDWGRAVAAGHLHNATAAKAAIAASEATLKSLQGTPWAYVVEGADTRIVRNEMAAWAAFAAGDASTAIANMQAAADEQDKVGQGEVDIPAREMLGDMLLESKRPDEALVAYKAALTLSPGRFNGLYHAGLAAEAAGKPADAAHFYQSLLSSTEGGKNSTRPEFVHVKEYLATRQLAAVPAQ